MSKASIFADIFWCSSTSKPAIKTVNNEKRSCHKSATDTAKDDFPQLHQEHWDRTPSGVKLSSMALIDPLEAAVVLTAETRPTDTEAYFFAF